MTRVKYSDELYHHGIKGQQWGVRRWQNEDGSLTPEGRKRYGEGEAGISKYHTARNVKRVVGSTLANINGAGLAGAGIGAGVGAATSGGLLSLPLAQLGAEVGGGVGAANAVVGNTKYLVRQTKKDARAKYNRYKKGKMSNNDRIAYERQLKSRNKVKSTLDSYAPWLSGMVFNQDY